MSALDPLFVELAALEAARSAASGGLAADDAEDPGEWLGLAGIAIDRADATIGDPEGEGDAGYRDALMRAATICLAAVRCVDRARKVSS